MSRHAGIGAFGSWLIMLAFMAADAAPAATSSREQPDEELDEVLVEGREPTRDPQQVIDWLARLAGRFTYEGYVELRGKGNPEDRQPVRGSADCVDLGQAHAVLCEIKLSWLEMSSPDGKATLGAVVNLNPAKMVFGFEPNHTGIRHMLVDNKGVAEGALGLLFGDTLVSRAPCVGISGNCQRAVRITATSDLKVVQTRIDIEIGSRRVVRFMFVQRRVPGSSAVAMPGELERSN